MRAWLVGLVDRHISAVACSILLGTPAPSIEDESRDENADCDQGGAL